MKSKAQDFYSDFFNKLAYVLLHSKGAKLTTTEKVEEYYQLLMLNHHEEGSINDFASKISVEMDYSPISKDLDVLGSRVVTKDIQGGDKNGFIEAFLLDKDNIDGVRVFFVIEVAQSSWQKFLGWFNMLKYSYSVTVKGQKYKAGEALDLKRLFVWEPGDGNPARKILKHLTK